MPVRECECECNLLALQNLVTKGEEQGESPQSRRERAQGEGTRPCFCALPLLSSDFCQRVLVFFLFVTPSCPPPLPGPEGKEARGSGEEQGGKQGEEGLGFSRFSSPLVGRLFLFFFLFSLDGETKGHEEEDERGEREQRAPPPKGEGLGPSSGVVALVGFFSCGGFYFSFGPLPADERAAPRRRRCSEGRARGRPCPSASSRPIGWRFFCFFLFLLFFPSFSFPVLLVLGNQRRQTQGKGMLCE